MQQPCEAFVYLAFTHLFWADLFIISAQNKETNKNPHSQRPLFCLGSLNWWLEAMTQFHGRKWYYCGALMLWPVWPWHRSHPSLGQMFALSQQVLQQDKHWPLDIVSVLIIPLISSKILDTYPPLYRAFQNNLTLVRWLPAWVRGENLIDEISIPGTCQQLYYLSYFI